MSETRDEGGAAMSGGGGGGPEEDEAATMAVTPGEPARKRYVCPPVFSLSLSLSLSLCPSPHSPTDAPSCSGRLGTKKAKGRGGGVQRVPWLRGQD